MKYLFSVKFRLFAPASVATAVVAASVLLSAVVAGAARGRAAGTLHTWAAQLGLPMQTAPRQTAPADTGRYKPSARPRLRTVRDRAGSRFAPGSRRSPLVLPVPKTVQLQVTPTGDSLKEYQVRETVGAATDNVNYRDPSTISQEQLLRFQEQQAINDYYRQKSRGGVAATAATPGSPQAQRLIPKIYLGPIADRIFGGSYVDIRPAGSVTLKFGGRVNTNRNPALTLRQQSVGDFVFDQNMNLSLAGQIGTKLKLTFNYDTKAAFDFDNQMKFDYAGQPTDILRKLDLGNVSMPLNNTLITGGSNLFGAKAQLQFGRLGVTALAATLRGSQDEVRVQNGAQSRIFELKASQYERDRHFFLAQFFRDRYDQSLRTLPTVQSGVQVRRLEVWVTNDNRTTDQLRNVVALQDIAEPRRDRVLRAAVNNPASQPTSSPQNPSNLLYRALLNAGPAGRDNLQVEQTLGNLPVGNTTLSLVKNLDYERVRARKLNPNEYTYNAQLGYVNLNTALLPDQALSVSYEYLYNGKSYTVGETQSEYGGNAGQDQVIFLKLLRATNPGVGVANPNTIPGLNRDNPTVARYFNTPAWDLMMKNVYPLNTSQVNRDNFQLQIIYKDDITGVDLISLKEGLNVQNLPLVQVLGLDRVNANNDRNPDGNFDFLSGITIDPDLGKIIFPSIEPFGSYLRAQYDTVARAATSSRPYPVTQAQADNERRLAQYYTYQALYTQTQSDAQQQQTKDKFVLRGRYQGTSTDEINLPGIGIAQGSVKVFAGSTLLTEGTDYQVFYDQAKVKILNPAYLNSANELRVSFEKNALVQVQPRRLLGTRLDFALNRDISFGATAMHILENQAPGINRVNVGDEPANNTILGADVSLRRDSRLLTKLVDALPFYSTKEVSSFAFTGEVAKLFAGRSQLGRGEDGASYLDDFENARTPYSLGGLASIPAWRLAATPTPIVGSTQSGLANAYRRAKLAWYTVDQSYYTGGPTGGSGVSAATLANHYTRGIPRNEVFPNRDLGATGNGYEYTFDMAYFPEERGPYNFTPNITADGRYFTPISNPAANTNKFAGISRGITFDTDFDNANVEYVEFWLMDPFKTGRNGLGSQMINEQLRGANGQIYGDNTTGGRLVINLGNVSEDALADQDQHEFENGLPTPADANPIPTVATPFGVVTTQQFLTDAFNASAGARAAQDVGLDGVNDAGEQAQFAGTPYGALPDPAGDNFRHHLDPSYQAASAQVLTRYRDYDNYEGNSPEGSQLSSTAYPDKEDLNRDNVVQNNEGYYEYSVELTPPTAGGLPSLEVGQGYVTDKIVALVPSVTGGARDSVTWFQFRVPVRQPSATVGTISGFKNIRFVRMYLTGWQQPVVLRMVQPQFVANQWRQYLYRISDPNGTGGAVGVNTDAQAFAVSTVSVEENGPAYTGTSATPNPTTIVPYVTPPGIRRDTEYGSTSVARQQNEQSLRLTVQGLQDGYAKAAYKNLTTNLLRYKRLRMFVHGEKIDASSNLENKDVRVFIRIGTDYSQNYYEYSIPLTLTKSGDTDPLSVWPEANNIDLALQDFIDAKSARNRANPPQYTVPFPYPVGSNEGIITVVGNPDLSQVQGVMIGILNPAGGRNTDPRSVTIWADELRVFDFETQGGWAANARANVKLADLANITATGSFIGVGFGGLQDKAQQRSTEDILRGDLNATIAADKLLPAGLHLKVPVLVQVGRETRAPQYDPLDPDTKLEQSLQKFNNQPDAAQRAQEYRDLVVTRTSSRSISLLNVRKERGPTQTKVHPWDIENVAVSYAITERLYTDINTQRDYTRSFTAALAYVYQTQPKNYTPLAQVKALNNPYLKIFQSVNITPLPTRFSFRTDLDRRYNERFLQRVTEPGQLPSTVGVVPVFYKSFYINRIYDLNWALTQALTLDYTATNRGVIDEGIGRSIGDSPDAQRNQLLLRENLLRGGRTTNFNQTIAATYRLPLDKFPLTDWLSASTRYSAHYTWLAASTALRAPAPRNPIDPDPNDTTTVRLNLGNTIQNNAEVSANGKIDLVKLYNKVKFLNIINNAQPKPFARPMQADEGNPQAQVSPTRPKPAERDTARKDPLRLVKAALRAIMTARSIDFTYSRSTGTLLPGYLPSTQYLGFAPGFTAPGVGFILGQQYEPRDLYARARDNGWYANRSEYLNTPLSNILTENITARTALEPFRGFNIQLDLKRQVIRNAEAYYRRAIDTTTATYRVQGELTPFNDGRLAASQALGSGSYSVSTITIATLFGDLGANGETSKAFEQFIQNRGQVQNTLQRTNPFTTVQTPGAGGTTTPTRQQGYYSYNSQDVLLPAFLDAYWGRSSSGYESEKFNPFKLFPLPNWTIQYNGLADLPGIRNLFRSFNLRHAYSSVYNLGSYTTTTRYDQQPDFYAGIGQGIPYLLNSTGQYVPYYVVGQVSFLESMAPLAGLDFQTVNSVTGRAEYRTSRAIALNITNAQVTELHTSELVVGLGYSARGLKLPFRVGGEQRVLKNTLSARLDLSIRDNYTVQRSIVNVVDEQRATATSAASVGVSSSQVTNGALTVQLRPTIDYLLNTRLNLQFYYTQTITQPRVSNAFRNSSTEGGIQLRYSLQ